MKGLILITLGLLVFSSCGKKGDGDGVALSESGQSSETADTEAERLKRISALNALESNAEFSTYVELTRKHAAFEKFQGEEKRTYLVPTNTAFKELSDQKMQRLQESPSAFNELWETMSLPQTFTLEELRELEKTTNTEGRTVSVERANNYIWVEGAPIMIPDVKYNNGIIHGVDIIYNR